MTELEELAKSLRKEVCTHNIQTCLTKTIRICTTTCLGCDKVLAVYEDEEES